MLNIYDGNGYLVGFEGWNFSGGECFFRIKPPHGSGPVRIEARLYSSNDVLQLLMATDALRRRGFRDIDLVMPYVPYARQDRVCNEGEALSIKVFCDMINAQKYRSVEIWDAHSDVTPALLDRCTNIPQKMFFRGMPYTNDRVFVAPDAGAAKKTFDLAKEYNGDYVVAEKVRNTVNGEIISIELSLPKYKYGHRRFVIVDDICDGGKTFIELAKVIRNNLDGEKYSKTLIDLYVTHGIFSKGLDVLRPYIDHVYTANIWPDRYQGNEDYVTVLRR